MTSVNLQLLHLCDSLFPTGGFAHSDGLEHATASGAISTPAGLGEWLDVCLAETIGSFEGPAMIHALAAVAADRWTEIVRLDREVVALKPSATLRRGSRAMGLRLVTSWHAAYGHQSVSALLSLARRGEVGPTLPIAFGCVAAAIGEEARAAAEAFAYTRLAATVSAAMRLMPLGQTDAHRLLAQRLTRVPSVVDGMLSVRSPLRSFTPATDMAAMGQQYLHSRLFLS